VLVDGYVCYHARASDCSDRDVRCRMIMKREYDFEVTWTTIPRVREAPEQGSDGVAFVRVQVYVQDVVNQDACISKQYWW